MNPPPGLPQNALNHLNRGEAALESKDFANSAGEYGEALDEAPWLSQGYRGLARAREGAGDLYGAIEASTLYLLASQQADDAMEVKAHAAGLGQRIIASQNDQSLRDEIQRLQLKQQEEEAEQARIRAQEQAQEIAREEQRRQEAQRQVEQERRCVQNFVGSWGEYDTYCCGDFETGSTSFLPSGSFSSGYMAPGLDDVFQIELNGSRLEVYQTVATSCHCDSRTSTQHYTHRLAFNGELTGHATNWSGNCSFTASGEIHHDYPAETVPVIAVNFYVSDDGNTLTWGYGTFRRQ